MPPTYADSKVFCIRSANTPLVFIGATTSSLAQHLSVLKYKYKKWVDDKTKKYKPVFEILKYDDSYIELITLFPCNNIEQLKARMYAAIRECEFPCVNKMGITKPLDEVPVEASTAPPVIEVPEE